MHNWVQVDRRQAEQPQGALNEDERAELARLRAEKARWAKDKAELEMERDVLKRCWRVGEGRDEPVIVAEFIASQPTGFGVPHAIACRALQVSQAWFYNKRINHKPTARDQRREQLDEQIRRLFMASGDTYGSPRITDDLRDVGWRLSENTVAARMVELGRASAEAAPVAGPAGSTSGRAGSGPSDLHRGGAGRAVVRGCDPDRHR